VTGRSGPSSIWRLDLPTLDAARSEAARVAASVELNDVRLFSVEGDLRFLPDDEFSRLSYAFDAGVQVHYELDDEALLVIGDYSLTVRARATDEESDAEPRDVASITFQMNALFMVDRTPAEPFEESELVAFGATTGQFALYPYARAFIADLTGRMGLPPLHVGVMRLNLDSKDG